MLTSWARTRASWPRGRYRVPCRTRRHWSDLQALGDARDRRAARDCRIETYGEIGIRLALGASRINVTRLVLHHALWPALLGIGAGLLASVAVTRVMRTLLFEVEPTDPLVLGAVSILLLAVAMVASMIPARRAMRVNTTEVLRME